MTVGMPVVVTPASMRRSEVGGILGSVVHISELPISDIQLDTVIGVRSLAGVIQNSETSPTLAVVELQRSPENKRGNRSGYVWNSKGDLPFAPKIADQLNVSIKTRNVSPISLVMPRLRLLLGLVPAEVNPEVNRKLDGSYSQSLQ